MNDDNTNTNAHHRYIIELDTPVWPRKLADELSTSRWVADHLISVTDTQNDTHIYGRTYSVDQDRTPGVVGGLG